MGRKYGFCVLARMSVWSGDGEVGGLVGENCKV